MEGSKVILLKDVVFSYGKVANAGDLFTISRVDEEGIWLDEIDIYIEHEYKEEYLKLIE